MILGHSLYLSRSEVLYLLLLFCCYVMSDSVAPWTEACQSSLSFTISMFAQIHVLGAI